MEPANFGVYWKPAGFTDLIPVDVVLVIAETREVVVDALSGWARAGGHRFKVPTGRLVIREELAG